MPTWLFFWRIIVVLGDFWRILYTGWQLKRITFGDRNAADRDG
jgi:hypothetical protein